MENPDSVFSGTGIAPPLSRRCDPPAMLRLARDDERTATEPAGAAGLSSSAASPHLKLLRDVGLLAMRADAQHRLYRVDPGRRTDQLDPLGG
jgi:DNA-binding transcriptional ArsR family regulator